MEMVKQAEKYAKNLSSRYRAKSAYPLERLESQTVMVDFIRELTGGTRPVMHDLYLARNQKEGDNTDNGHHIIKLKKVI
jgi:hypothetical protein